MQSIIRQRQGKTPFIIFHACLHDEKFLTIKKANRRIYHRLACAGRQFLDITTGDALVAASCCNPTQRNGKTTPDTTGLFETYLLVFPEELNPDPVSEASVTA